MKPSGLLSIKSLASKIHPQLPLNRKESQQLLHIVQTSFRKQLDLQHPPVHREDADDTPVHAHSSRSSAVNHIEALLSNPLLRSNHAPQKDTPRVSAAPAIDNAASLIQDPSHWFEERVANGNADLRAAKLCLKMLMGTKTAQNSTFSTEDIERSAVGSKILRWMYIEGLEDKIEFHTDRMLSYLLVLCLVAESRKYVVYDWALRLLKGNAPSLSHEENVLYGRYLVEAFVKAEFRLKLPLKVIVEDFLHILSGLNEGKSRAICKELFRAGLHINKSVLSTKSLDAPIYDAWTQNVHLWANGTYFLAQLKLHHPNKPGAHQAFKYIMDSTAREIKGKERQPIIDLCLDTARQLLNEQNNTDCLKVLRFAQQRFPEEFHQDASLQNLLARYPANGEPQYWRPTLSVG